MLRRYSFIPVVCCILGGLAWWSIHVKGAVSSRADIQPIDYDRAALVSRRQLLIEILDKIVCYEHYYHSVYGTYTRILNRIGVSIPRTITDVYDLHVSEATADQLLVNALSETRGQVMDLVSIDQAFRVHSSFEVPVPRPEYLRSIALKH